MEKKIYFQVDSNEDLSVTCNNSEQAFEMIRCDLENVGNNLEGLEYTIKPIYLTDEEYANLPEAN